MELKAILGMLGKSNPATAGMSMALGAGQMIAGSINRKKAEAANSDLVVETDDPLVNNYRADQPLEDNNDGD